MISPIYDESADRSRFFYDRKQKKKREAVIKDWT